jgi:predicted amidophosphoribosyltransferase
MANKERIRPPTPEVCPVCGEEVRRDALACPQCGADYAAAEFAVPEPAPEAREALGRRTVWKSDGRTLAKSSSHSVFPR